MSLRPYALRRRLSGLVAAAILSIGVLSVGVVYQRAHHEADELLDSQLVQVADTLLSLPAAEDALPAAEPLPSRDSRHVVPIAYEMRQTGTEGSRLLVASQGHRGFAPPVPEGFSHRMLGGVHWRLYTARDAGQTRLVTVGQRHSARDRLARETALSVLVPTLLALPVMALFVYWVVGQALRPVEALARSVKGWQPDVLAPLDPGLRLPQEIAPLRDAFNTLLARVSAMLETERRFTADAAHELRTPLAALKIQAQVARRTKADAPRQHALDQVLAGVDRMTHLVEQLLTLARVDQGAAPVLRPFDAATALDAAVAPLHTASAAAGQTLVLRVEPGLWPAMPQIHFEIAARNLIANAVHHAGSGARIEVTFSRVGDRVCLGVDDSGPGLDPAACVALRARFARGNTETPGCGLGLSIVERIAERAHGSFELGEGLSRPDGGRGLAARLYCTPGGSPPP